MTRVAVLHPAYGLMLGVGPLGIIWSHVQPMGQFTAATYASARAAVDDLVLHAKLPNQLRYPPVTVADLRLGATIAELRRAGLGDWVAPLERNFLCCVPAQGRA